MRKTPLRPGRPPQRRTSLSPVSKRRRREQKVRRSLSPPEGERCWLAITEVCTGAAEAWHELVGAGVGGSRVDPRNLCAVCNTCNGYVEGHRDRFVLGWKVHSMHAKRGVVGLVPAQLHPLSLAARKDAA